MERFFTVVLSFLLLFVVAVFFLFFCFVFFSCFHCANFSFSSFSTFGLSLRNDQTFLSCRNFGRSTLFFFSKTLFFFLFD